MMPVTGFVNAVVHVIVISRTTISIIINRWERGGGGTKENREKKNKDCNNFKRHDIRASSLNHRTVFCREDDIWHLRWHWNSWDISFTTTAGNLVRTDAYYCDIHTLRRHYSRMVKFHCLPLIITIGTFRMRMNNYCLSLSLFLPPSFPLVVFAVILWNTTAQHSRWFTPFCDLFHKFNFVSHLEITFVHSFGRQCNCNAMQCVVITFSITITIVEIARAVKYRPPGECDDWYRKITIFDVHLDIYGLLMQHE